MAELSSNPLVSVVIPSFRATAYLGEALESVFRQSYPNLEVLVVDQDCDELADQVLGPLEQRIRRLRLSPPSVSVARNQAILEAKGDLIALLDADDVWEDHAVRVLVDTLINRNADIVFGDVVFFGDTAATGRRFTEFFPAHRPVTYDDVASRRTSVSASVVGKRKRFIEAGLFDPAFRYGEDLDLWLRMLLQGARFDFTDQVICRYRRRSEAASSAPVVERLRRLVGVYDKQLALPGVSEDSRETLEAVRAKLCFDVSLEEGRMAIGERDYGTANRLLREVPASHKSTRLRMASFALSLCPRLVGPLLRLRMR